MPQDIVMQGLNNYTSVIIMTHGYAQNRKGSIVDLCSMCVATWSSMNLSVSNFFCSNTFITSGKPRSEVKTHKE